MTMLGRPCLVAVLCATHALFVGAADLEVATPTPQGSCCELVAAEEFAAALPVCREELQSAPEDCELLRATAAAEFAGGSATAAASLWRTILEREGWQADAAHQLAMSLWRAGRSAEAEPVLREIVDRTGSAEAYRALVDYLLSFDRVDEAIATATNAVSAHPYSCEIAEDLAVAQAAAELDEQAAASVARSRALGCPPFGWLNRGMLAQNYDRPAYAGLLSVETLIADLDELSDAQVRDRFKLLKPRMAPVAAPAVTEVVLERRTAEVRLSGLGLLTELGIAAAPFWQQILGTDDFILEKHALRRIREMGDPDFIPLLAARLEAEQTPGNRALTRLTIGELLLGKGEVEEATAMMEAIADDDQLHPVAMMALADFAEATGEPAAALTYVQRAQAADPMVFVTPSRLEKLQKAAGAEQETAPPAD